VFVWLFLQTLTEMFGMIDKDHSGTNHITGEKRLTGGPWVAVAIQGSNEWRTSQGWLITPSIPSVYP
jgi:hypothetical protein